MKVLQVIAPAPVGGAETVVLSLSEGLLASGHECEIAAIVAIVADGAEHPFVARARERSLRVSLVQVGRRAYRRQAHEIARYAQEAQVDVVHTHGYHADVVGFWGARVARRPVVSTLHGFTGDGLRDTLYDRIVRYPHRRCDAVVAVSEPIASRLQSRGIRPERIWMIRNAGQGGTPVARTEARAALEVHDAALRVGWVGRFSAEKGAEIMLDAFAHLPRGTVKLSMVGEGPQRGALEVQARQLGIAEFITWHGLVPDTSRYFSAFDLLVLSSHTEGSPMVVLEAMSSRLPIIATRVGGIPDMLTDDEAVLVPPGNPTAIAAAIESALGDPEAARRRAERAAGRHARDFSAEAWAKRHAELYAAVAGGSARPTSA